MPTFYPALSALHAVGRLFEVILAAALLAATAGAVVGIYVFFNV